MDFFLDGCFRLVIKKPLIDFFLLKGMLIDFGKLAITNCLTKYEFMKHYSIACVWECAGEPWAAQTDRLR